MRDNASLSGYPVPEFAWRLKTFFFLSMGCSPLSSGLITCLVLNHRMQYNVSILEIISPLSQICWCFCIFNDTPDLIHVICLLCHILSLGHWLHFLDAQVMTGQRMPHVPSTSKFWYVQWQSQELSKCIIVMPEIIKMYSCDIILNVGPSYDIVK